MLRRIQTTGSDAFLASRRPDFPTFQPHARMTRSLVPIWEALHAGEAEDAGRIARTTLQDRPAAPAAERAGLLAGLAGAEYAAGRLDHALRAARQSLDIVPAQWVGRRIVIAVLLRRREYQAAHAELSGLPVDLNGPSWDERMTARDVETALATCAWLLGAWDAAHDHLRRAWPEGPASMPEPIREDCFRVALFRNRPDEAAAVADLLVGEWAPERADELLQTLVQQGFTAEALPLYRRIHGLHPESELIRRRLVALCIREGAIDEARRLAAPAALRTAA